MRNVHRPALDFEPHFRMLNATYNERGLGEGKGLRALIYTALVLRRYPESSQAPNAALEAAIPILAVVGRARGCIRLVRLGLERLDEVSLKDLRLTGELNTGLFHPRP